VIFIPSSNTVEHINAAKQAISQELSNQFQIEFIDISGKPEDASGKGANFALYLDYYPGSGRPGYSNTQETLEKLLSCSRGNVMHVFIHSKEQPSTFEQPSKTYPSGIHLVDEVPKRSIFHISIGEKPVVDQKLKEFIKQL